MNHGTELPPSASNWMPIGHAVLASASRVKGYGPRDLISACVDLEHITCGPSLKGELSFINGLQEAELNSPSWFYPVRGATLEMPTLLRESSLIRGDFDLTMIAGHFGSYITRWREQFIAEASDRRWRVIGRVTSMLSNFIEVPSDVLCTIEYDLLNATGKLPSGETLYSLFASEVLASDESAVPPRKVGRPSQKETFVSFIKEMPQKPGETDKHFAVRLLKRFNIEHPTATNVPSPDTVRGYIIDVRKPD